MTDEFITYNESLYGKYLRELKAGVAFGIIASLILFVLAATVVVMNFVFIKVKVSGSSMYPTLKNGDVVTVNVYAEPDYGDILIISGEKKNGDWLIKRAIAFGGDTVKTEGGYVYLKKSGEQEFTLLDEPYLAEGVITPSVIGYPSDFSERIFEIAADEIFYLGDNRTNSSDSRSEYGACSKDQIIGTVSEFAVKTKSVNGFFEGISQTITGLFGRKPA